MFIYGKQFWPLTDHKPLVTTAKKAKTPPRVQRLFLKMQKYHMEVVYRPGKELLIADTLSRAYDITVPVEQHEQDQIVQIVQLDQEKLSGLR